MPGGTPPDRVEILRQALADMVRDPQFLADAEQAQLEIEFVPGARLQKLATDLLRTPPEIIQKFKEAVRSQRR